MTIRRNSPLTLAELVDLELQLDKDAGAETRDLVTRDAAIGREIDAAKLAGAPHELIRSWLASVRPPGEPSIGRRIHSYYRMAALVVSMFALGSGATTAAALLRYDGRDPVNVMGFLAVFVGLQLLLVLVALAGMLPAPWKRRMFRLSGLQEVVRDIGYRRSGMVAALERKIDVGAVARARLGRLTAVQVIYAEVERWLLVKLTQRAGVVFNVGALVVCLYLVTVRALAFAWSTTLEIDVTAMTALFHAIATPWSWWSGAVPDRDLVEASRYFPGRAYDADRLGDWWPFLIAALVTYGLLPRLLLAAYAGWRERSARGSLDLDHGGLAFLRERLLRPATGWGAGAAAGSEVPEQSSVPGVGSEPAPLEPGDVRVLAWADAAVSADAAARLVAGRFDRRMESFATVRGDGGSEDTAALAALAQGERGPVLVLAEAWEPPSKSVQRVLSTVRDRVGAAPPIVVGLLTRGAGRDPQGDDARIWRDRIAALADPRLRVEVLGA